MGRRPPCTLVLLPGLDGTDVFFRPLVAELPEWIRPVVVSYPTTGPNGYDHLLPIVRRAIANTARVHLLGSSFSGPLAVMLAAAEPRAVAGVILSATFLRAPRRGLTRLGFVAVPPLVGLWRTARRIPVWALRPKQDPLRRAKTETWRRVSSQAVAARIRAIRSVDVRDRFRACNQPILCVTYAGDRVIPRRCAEEILVHRPSTEMVTLPGDHLGMHAHPRELAAQVVRFLGAATSKIE